MDVLVRVVVGLNALANALGGYLLAPVGVLPGWLSATLVAAVTGVLLLVVFKYTSNQRAIKRVRDDIDANLLALKLFKDSVPVTLRAQGRLLVGAGRLLVLALVPTAVMVVPVTLALGQLSLWYQQRPLRVGEEAVVTLALNGAADAPFPKVSLRPTDSAVKWTVGPVRMILDLDIKQPAVNRVETTVGPVRVFSKREVCWTIKAQETGYQRLEFQVGDQVVSKELAVGNGFMRVSARRPAWVWSEALLYPAEGPLPPDSPVRSIDVAYPERPSWVSGTDYWVVFWFAVSLAVAFCFRRVLGVHV